MASQSVFRGPGAKHYAVVHRSMRDPLINDPEAGDRVLAEVTRANAERRVGKPVTRGELEASLDGNHQRANVGEASLYDIYFDDTEYDYMQHLRPTGQPEAFFVEAPERQGGSKGKREAGRADEIIALRGDAAGAGSDDIVLPQGVRPTPDASTLSYKDHLEFALPANSARIGGGLQPDMDPGLREVLEALDDDEYVEDAADDDFFGGLVEDGEREEDEVPAWSANGGGQAMDSQWDRLVGTVKQAAKARSGPMMEDGSGEGSEDEAEYASEAGDTIAELRASSMRRPPRQGGAVAGSAFSMSSSAMFRNEGLTSLDERFDQVGTLHAIFEGWSLILDSQIEKEYENSSTSGSDGEPEDIDNTSMQASHASVLNRADLDDIFDDFLDHYEVLGGKLKGKLEGETPLDKLATMRKELARISDDPQLAEGEERARTKADILARVERAERREAERRAKGKYREERTSVEVEDDPAERWDCQTILSGFVVPVWTKPAAEDDCCRHILQCLQPPSTRPHARSRRDEAGEINERADQHRPEDGISDCRREDHGRSRLARERRWSEQWPRGQRRRGRGRATE